MYRYIHNLQGDIIGIVDANGTLVVEYKYDAWGKPIVTAGVLASALGILNPFRYRGYVWDEENELYYLRNRYYYSEQCRFINQDLLLIAEEMTSGVNLFVYCANKPSQRKDTSGTRYIDALSIQQETERERINAIRYTRLTRIAGKVHVYKKDIEQPIDGMINVQIYVANQEMGYVNMHISDSLKFTFIEEIDTVLDEIMKSDYYSEELFGTKEFMRAQWVGHNLTYQLALSGDIGFKIARSASGSDDPIQSSQELDIRCLDNLIKRQRYAYKMIEIILDWGN